jgi:cell division protein FtsN
MQNFFLKTYSLFLLTILFSCSLGSNNHANIRIVDLQGKARKINTRVPELNVQAIAAQEAARKIGNNGVVPKSDFGAVSANNIQQTIQPSFPKNTTNNFKKQPLQTDINNSNQITEKTPPSNLQGSEPNLNIVQEESEKPVKEYDLAEVKEEKQPEAVDANAIREVLKPSREASSKITYLKASNDNPAVGKFYVQIGSFESKDNAQASLLKMKKFGSGKLETIDGDKVIYRALIGPFKDKTSAIQIMQKIKKSGHDAIVTKIK